jgi:hypothetical protein
MSNALLSTHYGPLRLPAAASTELFIPPHCRHGCPCPLRRVSQVPRLFCPRAPSVPTPESSAGAPARFFPADIRLHPTWKTGRFHLRNEAKTGSLALRLTCSPHQASSGRLLCRTLVWLLVERAIYKVNSFQFTRTARLILALQVSGTPRRKPPLHRLTFRKFSS